MVPCNGTIPVLLYLASAEKRSHPLRELNTLYENSQP